MPTYLRVLDNVSVSAYAIIKADAVQLLIDLNHLQFSYGWREGLFG